MGLPEEARLAFAVQSTVRVLVLTRKKLPHVLHMKLASNYAYAYTRVPGLFASNVIFELEILPLDDLCLLARERHTQRHRHGVATHSAMIAATGHLLILAVVDDVHIHTGESSSKPKTPARR